MRFKIINNRRKIRQNELATLSYCVVDNMEDNPAFPNPPAALAQLKKINPAFLSSLAHAIGGGKEMVALKDKNKKIVLNLLDELATYVTNIWKGDRLLLLNSGFDIAKIGGQGSLPAIKKLDVIMGESGEVTSVLKTPQGL